VDCDLQRLGLAAKPRGRAIRAQSLALQLRATLRRTDVGHRGPLVLWGQHHPETILKSMELALRAAKCDIN